MGAAVLADGVLKTEQPTLKGHDTGVESVEAENLDTV